MYTCSDSYMQSSLKSLTMLNFLVIPFLSRKLHRKGVKMKRNLGKHVSENVRRLKEDMQELQRLMTHNSVYARQTVREYARRPKHPKRYNGLYANY